MSVYDYEAKRLIKEDNDNNEKEYTIIIETCLSNEDIDKLFESYLSEEAFKKSIDIKENKKGTTYKIFIRNIEGGGTNGKSSQHPNKPSVKLITGKIEMKYLLRLESLLELIVMPLIKNIKMFQNLFLIIKIY